jgi:DUF971 family protein
MQHIPTDIKLLQKSRVVEITFSDQPLFILPCEYLRVYSPSAEVRGHGGNDAVLQTGKKNVNISSIEMVGNYAVKFIFDDGHATGIYSWDYLYDLAVNQEKYWHNYIGRLAVAGKSRDL